MGSILCCGSEELLSGQTPFYDEGIAEPMASWHWVLRQSVCFLWACAPGTYHYMLVMMSQCCSLWLWFHISLVRAAYGLESRDRIQRPWEHGSAKARMLAIRRSQEEAFTDGIFFPFHFPSASSCQWRFALALIRTLAC